MTKNKTSWQKYRKSSLHNKRHVKSPVLSTAGEAAAGHTVLGDNQGDPREVVHIHRTATERIHPAEAVQSSWGTALGRKDLGPGRLDLGDTD